MPESRSFKQVIPAICGNKKHIVDSCRCSAISAVEHSSSSHVRLIDFVRMTQCCIAASYRYQTVVLLYADERSIIWLACNFLAFSLSLPVFLGGVFELLAPSNSRLLHFPQNAKTFATGGLLQILQKRTPSSQRLPRKSAQKHSVRQKHAGPPGSGLVRKENRFRQRGRFRR